MATGVYSLKTLQDNWFEDRCQPQGGLTATVGDKRTSRKYETDLAYIGERYDVLSRISRSVSRPSFATPDYGFRERTSTHLADFKNPKEHATESFQKVSAPPMINRANAPVRPPEMRPLDGPETGFGASIQRHKSMHDFRAWNTTHGDFFGYGQSRSQRSLRACPTTLRPSGVASEDMETRGSGMKCGKLCGEGFREEGNPAMDTRVQRAWLPSADAGIRHIHLGGSKPELPRVDNHLSLPLGDGAMSKVRADLKNRNGRLCRVATNITKGAHHKPGVSLFQDD
eukprot:CAMPEP_0170249310 /NCGR_PEP_ID=MMETSP0116_2-20130129/24458_1 /TAXON_ID=400756 /ORGANISM="Durinskia baltica, Strain CSIRO CS-38" /LENGTH=283 /DNA_ID=CAMNT_0010500219 /DNA_START=86 /DNA_END=937 /DNA_ORIENTATION=-